MLYRLRKQRSQKFEIQLTSLIDIIVFLLVFLIQAATITKLNLNLRVNIELPRSETRDEADRGITVQLTKNLEVFIEDKSLALETGTLWTDNNANVIREKIKEVKLNLEQVINQSKTSERFNVVMNLAMDKGLDYLHVKNLMDIAAGLGIEQFKFIVMEK